MHRSQNSLCKLSLCVPCSPKAAEWITGLAQSLSPQPPLPPMCLGLESGLETCPEQWPASWLPAPGAVHGPRGSRIQNRMSWKLVSRLRGHGSKVEP